MNILLVNPYIHDVAAYDLWVRPLGLLYVGASLERFGYRVSMVDPLDRFHSSILGDARRPKGNRYGCGHFPETVIETPVQYKRLMRTYHRYGFPVSVFLEELEKLERPQAILVGSMMTYWYPGVFETVRLLRQTFQGVPIALGGVYATLCYEHARQFSGADQVIPGWGEVSALRWVDSVCGKDRDYSSLDPADPEFLPMPAHHLTRSSKPAVILTSWGCPFSCSYCASNKLQPLFRQRDPKSVVKEIEHLYRKRRVRDIAFYDDSLLVYPEKHAKVIFEELAERKFHLRFHLPNGVHSRPLDRQMCELFRKTNVETIRLSYEYRDNKVEDPDLAFAVENLKASGYGSKNKIEVYVKTGLPGQSVEEIIAAYLFVHSLGALIRITEFSPVPGTPDFDKSSNGSLDLSEPLFHNKSAYLVLSEVMSRERLNELKNMASVLNHATQNHFNFFGKTDVEKMIQKTLRMSVFY